MRKDNPQLKQLLDEFITPLAVGTSFGNTLVRRYLQNTKWVKGSTSQEEMKKFEALSAIFKQYAGQYDFDYLMIMAQGHQESLLDQNKRNPSGSIGIMQVIPKNAAAAPINVPDVTTAQNNTQAGIKMLRNIEDQYFNDPKLDPVNKLMMVFASYNAGPNRIARLRQQASQEGLIPTNGLATSTSWWPRTLDRKRSITSATFTSITSPISWRWGRCSSRPRWQPATRAM